MDSLSVSPLRSQSPATMSRADSSTAESHTLRLCRFCSSRAGARAGATVTSSTCGPWVVGVFSSSSRSVAVTEEVAERRHIDRPNLP